MGALPLGRVPGFLFSSSTRSRLASAWRVASPGREPFTVDYPDEFDVKSLEKEIEDAVKLKSLQISPTFEAELLKRLAKKALPKITDEKADEIEEEIMG